MQPVKHSCIIFLILSWCCAGFVARADYEHVTPERIDSLRNALKPHMHDTSRVNTLNSLSDHLKSQDMYEAMQYSKQAYDLADKIGYAKGKGISLGIMGTLYERMSDYRQALFCYLRSLKIFEDMGDKRLQSVTLNYIGSVYMWIGRNDLAEKYYMQTLQITINLGLKKTYGISYNNLGVIAYNTKQYKKAEMYYRKSIAEAEKYDLPWTCVPSLLNLAILHSDWGQHDSAEIYYMNALKYTDNYRDSITAFSGLGRVYGDKKQYALSEASFLRAEKMAMLTGINYVLRDMYRDMAAMYRSRKDYKKADQYNELYHNLKDSALNNSTTKKISDMQMTYEVEKKDKEIQLLEQKKQVAEMKENNQRLLRNMVIVVAAALVLLVFFITRNKILKQKMKNRELSEQNTLIEKDNMKLQNENTEAKYEILRSKTNPHFLFNGFTMLSSLIIKNPRLAIEYIEHFSELYRMILKSGDTHLVSMEEEIALVEHYIYIQQRWYRDDLKVHMETEPDDAYKLPSFSLQMLVENAIKHNVVSGDQPLYITITREEDSIVVKNNLQKKMVYERSTGLGQKNIKERYRLISGRQPEFMETKDAYIATLPLLLMNKEVHA